MNNLNQPNQTTANRSSTPMLIVSWLLVGVPAAWGVTQTFYKSLPLFHSAPPPTSQVAK